MRMRVDGRCDRLTGAWKFDLDHQDHSAMTYLEGANATFLMGCG